MDSALLQTLLHQTENEELDFKTEQYRLVRADNETKSELLKDILAMANAWKSGDAHILIGVKENNGRAEEVVGVVAHLEDASLQQLVNEKTDKPVSFGYAVVDFKDRKLGVITIKRDQDRPITLRRDFGKLKAGKVYIRRGSSTAEASANECRDMGRAAEEAATTPVIEFEFADPNRGERRGRELVCTSTLLLEPPPPDPPAESYGLLAKKGTFSGTSQFLNGLRGMRLHPMLGPSSQADLKARHQYEALLTGVGFWLQNAGATTAHDVRVHMRMSKVEGVLQLDETTHPKNRWDFGVTRSKVHLQERGEDQILTIEAGKLQPKAEVWIPEHWYIGSSRSCRLPIEASVFADNLPNPREFDLAIDIDVVEREYYVEDFVGDDFE